METHSTFDDADIWRKWPTGPVSDWSNNDLAAALRDARYSKDRPSDELLIEAAARLPTLGRTIWICLAGTLCGAILDRLLIWLVP